MSQQDYFKDVLSNFTHEAASGGAIRHLADLGYTVRQIREQLTFPTPCDRIRRIVWERLLDEKVILLEEPGSGKQRKKADYVMEHDRYGRTSFRMVPRTEKEEDFLPLCWKERDFERESDLSAGAASSEERSRRLSAYLAEKCRENGEKDSYVSCDFGLQRRKEETEFQQAMELLTEREREYITGLFQEIPYGGKRCYHRLDQRMREIVARLYGEEKYHGICYFLRSQEKVTF